MLTDEQREKRYRRILAQLEPLMEKSSSPVSKMATTAALLHHKMSYFFWTGFYFLLDGELTVGPYQGPLACQVLEKHRGVCWAAVRGGRTLIVPDVHAFPGHIACDGRSNSEIAVPLLGPRGKVWAVLDVDSRQKNAFTPTDAEWLERIVERIPPFY